MFTDLFHYISGISFTLISTIYDDTRGGFLIVYNHVYCSTDYGNRLQTKLP